MMMRSINSQRGFSVFEVSIAAFLTVGLLGVVFAMVNRNQGIFVTETNVTDLNQNVRVAMDLITRDLQTAAMGLPSAAGSMDAIYYNDGASNAPDAMLLLNGDAYAPWVDVDSVSGTTFTCTLTGDVVATGTGTSSVFTYSGAGGTTLNMFQAYSTSPKRYIVYDTTKAMVMRLSANGQKDAVTGKLTLSYDSGNYVNPASTFGTALGGATIADNGAPADYTTTRIAMLGSMVGYRVNTTTRELERTEDLINWYSVARGITDMQVQYLCITPTDPTGTLSSAPTDRGTVRAVEIRLFAETADLPPAAPGYRRVVQMFRVAPRNFNLLNNVNLSSDVD